MLVLISLLLLQACGHPLEIVGEGDIVDLNGSGRGCTLEQFQSQDNACYLNLVTGAYDVNYRAVPRPGWEFVRWDGPCAPQSVAPDCRLSFSAESVKRFHGEVMPATIAVFSNDLDGDGYISELDLYPNNPAEWADLDSDGIPDNQDAVIMPTLSLLDNDYPVYGQYRGIIKKGDKIYVAGGSQGLLIYQIDSNGNLALIGSRHFVKYGYQEPYARSLLLIDNYMYVACRGRGLVIVDVSNPARMTEVYSFLTGWKKATFLERSGSTLFVSDRHYLHVFDISNVAQPVYISRHVAQTEYERTLAVGNILYAAGFYDGLVVINISDRSRLTITKTVNLGGYAIWALAKKDNYLYAAGEGSGLYVLDITNPADPKIITSINLPSQALEKPSDQPPFDIELHGGFLYIADGFSGVQIVDIRNPAEPVLVDSFIPEGYTFDVAFDGLTMLVGSYDGFSVVDLGATPDVDGDGIPNYLDPDPRNSN